MVPYHAMDEATLKRDLEAEVAALNNRLADARFSLAKWRSWAHECMTTYGGYLPRVRDDVEMRALLGITFGWNVSAREKLTHSIRMLVAHQRGVVRLTEAVLRGLDERSTDDVADRSGGAADHADVVANGTADAAEQVIQGQANGSGDSDPKL